ncbi:cell division protein FtsL [Alteribacter keqinensis]|uniref:Cell division protein FtsL n=1 Tax=Alteribacter keqinensis TaxID=2483800 RepID=A0A3M7TW38_9BACI|nr:cell division protein FtsL [Alteribacter keqinensis]RNA69693.1 cell division protein FtsL [Alteribacter keqinensis]
MSLAKQQIQQPLHQPERQLKQKKQRVFKGGITRGEKIIYPLTFLAVVFAAYVMLSNYATIYIANHEIQKTERSITEQSSVNEGLSLQVKDLSEPDRILHIAQAELGMELNDQNVRVIQNQD